MYKMDPLTADTLQGHATIIIYFNSVNLQNVSYDPDSPVCVHVINY